MAVARRNRPAYIVVDGGLAAQGAIPVSAATRRAQAVQLRVVGASGLLNIERATDDELIRAARSSPADEADRLFNALYRRYYQKVGYWCLRISRNRQEAADLVQEVFLRVHSRVDSFRMDSRFSTWLYTVMRSVAINRGLSAQRHETGRVDVDDAPEPSDPRSDPAREAETNQQLRRLRAAMATDLDPLESRVLYLHHVDGLTLPAITRLLGLSNKSGAKAFIVSGMRKLKRRLRGPASGRLRAVE